MVKQVIKNQDQNKIKNPNEKPHIINRIISGLIDASIVFMVFTGLYFIFMSTPISNPMMNYYDEMRVIQDSTIYNTGLGYKNYDFDTGTSQRIYYDDLGKEYIITINPVPGEGATEAEIKAYMDSYNSYNEEMKNNAAYNLAETYYKLNNFGLICLDALIVEGIFYFIIPLIDKRGRTIGKIIAKIQPYSNKHQGRVRWHQTLRTFLFKLIALSIIPFVFLNQLTVVVTALISLLFALCNKQNRTLHDLVSGTRIIKCDSFVPLVKTEIIEKNKESTN